MKPSRKKSIYVGYSETSRAHRIYIPGEKQIKISIYVTSYEDATFFRSRESHLDVETKEHESSLVI